MKRMICEGGYTKADAEREARALAKRASVTKVAIKRVRVRGGHEYKVCWRRK